MFNLPDGIKWDNANNGIITFTTDSLECINNLAETLNGRLLDFGAQNYRIVNSENQNIAAISFSAIWKVYTIAIHGSWLFK